MLSSSLSLTNIWSTACSLQIQSYQDYRSQKIENVHFPTSQTSATSHKVLQKNIAQQNNFPLPSDRLNPALAGVKSSKSGRSILFMYIQKMKFIQTSNLSTPSIFKHHTHPSDKNHYRSPSYRAPIATLQGHHCKPKNPQNTSLGTREIGETRATKEVIFNSSKQGSCQKDKSGSCHIIMSHFICALFPQK